MNGEEKKEKLKKLYKEYDELERWQDITGDTSSKPTSELIELDEEIGFLELELEEELCQVCGKNSDECECVCPECNQPCFDDVTTADHNMCYDCHKSKLNGEDEE